MAGTFGTKQLFAALGLGMAIAGYQYYGLSQDASEKEAAAKVKTIPNGLKDGIATPEKILAQNLEAKKAVEAEQDEIVELDEHLASVNESAAVVNSLEPTVTAPIETPSLNVTPPILADAAVAPAPVIEGMQTGATPRHDETKSEATKAEPPQVTLAPTQIEKPIDAKAQAAVTEVKRAELLAQLQEQNRCLPENGNFLNVRFKHFLFRVNMAEGFQQTSPQLKSFIGRAKETKVGALEVTDCKSGACYSLAEKLLAQVTEDKTPTQKFECGTWLLVAEKTGDSCTKETNFKTLSLTNDPGDKCIVGGLTDVQVSGVSGRAVAATNETVSTYMTVQRKNAPLQSAAKTSEESDEK